RQEGFEVLIGPLRHRALGLPLTGYLIHPAAHVAVSGAGVVCADPIAAKTPQQLVNRLAGHLAEEIPERDVDGGETPHLHAAAAEPDIGGTQRMRVLVDAQGVLAQQVGCRALMDVGSDGIGAEEGLAQAYRPLIGMDLDPQKIGELREQYSFDRGDPHAFSSECDRWRPRRPWNEPGKSEIPWPGRD